MKLLCILSFVMSKGAMFELKQQVTLIDHGCRTVARMLLAWVRISPLLIVDCYMLGLSNRRLTSSDRLKKLKLML